MKKLMYLIAVFAALNTFAATIVVKDPPEHYTTEYFELQFTFFDYPVFSKTRDEDDRPKLVMENKNFIRYSEILRIQQKNGKETLSLAYLEGDTVKWKKLKGKQSFITYEYAGGSLIGYVYLEYELERGMGLPPAKCIIAGKLTSFKWDKSRNKYMAGTGGAYVAGGNKPQDFEAFNLAFPATPVTPDKILPVSGKCHIAPYGYLTEAQIRRTLQQYGRK